MRQRTAKRGSGAGQRFWGCTNYPDCKRTLAEGEEPDLGLEGSPVTQLRAMVARPLRKGLQSVYFEALTVPHADLRQCLDGLARNGVVPGLHWRCEYRAPRSKLGRGEALLRALNVLEKLVFRGATTLLSQDLEGALSLATPSRLGHGAALAPFDGFEFDSDAERCFCCDLLPGALGDGWQRWVVPQVELGTLVGSRALADSEQRVDFLVWHPSFRQPVVVEIDGDQYHVKQADDERDEILRRAGYRVERIEASEVHAHRGPRLDSVLRGMAKAVAEMESDEGWASPHRRAGQIQATLLHSLTVGLLDPITSKPLSVASDVVAAGEMTATQFAAVVADFGELAQRVGGLYDVSLFPGGLEASPRQSGADIAIAFHGQVDGDCLVCVDDVFLPFRLAHRHLRVEPGLPSTWNKDELEYFLRRVFRKPGFWEGQYEAIDRAFKGQDAIVLLPTGAGKSIAFQLASLLVPGPAIVVEPIRALMHDQVENLAANYGIDRAIGITAEISGAAKRAAYDLLIAGQFLLAYVAPERFQIKEFRQALAATAETNPVGLIVIDEAHCVSEWGHDFRTSYLRIGDSTREFCRSKASTPPLLALTGTASYAVLKDLQRELRIEDPSALVTPASFDRPELHFEVLRCPSSEKEQQLRHILSEVLPQRLDVVADEFLHGSDGAKPGLVFCPFVGTDFGVVAVRDMLRQLGLRCDLYSGKPPKDFDRSQGGWDKHKREVSRRFKDDELQVLACTKAFGMGIDKPNVRFTIHYCMPPSVEAFYQEAGRAGRDRSASFCFILCSDEYVRDHPELLSKSMAIEDVSKARRQVGRYGQDDALRLLFFQEKSFRGIDHELDVLGAVLKQWMGADAKARASGWLPLQAVDRSDGRDGNRRTEGQLQDDAFAETERALHRLLVLAVVDDYRAVYKDKSFEVHPSLAKPERIIDAYVRYVASYQPGRARKELKKAQLLGRENRLQFIIDIARLYIEFVYEVIEKGRRQAMDTMRLYCLASDGDAFRQQILNYLTHTEFSERLDSMATDAGGGLELTPDLLADAPGPADASRLRGQTARYLESYPDHPGFLLLRGLTEARCQDASPTVIRDSIDGFLASAGSRYSIPTGDLAGAVSIGVDALRPVDRKNADRLEAATVRVDGYLDGDVARHLIAQRGVDNCPTVVWNLLLADAHGALQACGEWQVEG